MKKKISFILACTALFSMLILSGCGESDNTKASESAAEKKEMTEKPAGVPSSTFNKVKSLESQHNDQVEKALEP